MTNEEYIRQNINADIRSLALRKVPEGVNALWCLRQIEGHQLATKKLPRWAATEGLWYPPRLSMEQCSSEAAAQYKRSITSRITADGHAGVFVDLTGGFGVDFSYMARDFRQAVYVEREEVLCQAATHNMPLLGVPQARIECSDGLTFLNSLDHADIIYLDPARRDSVGKKTVAIEDCTPDICSLQDELLRKARHAIIKLSPMLDITQALRSLHSVSEVHVVSVKGECKELLFVLSAHASHDTISCHCVNLMTDDTPFTVPDYGAPAPADLFPASSPLRGLLLLEPNASILKAGVQNAFAAHYGLRKLHPMSNLFVCSEDAIAHTSKPPARIFRIQDAGDFSKASLKSLLKDVRQGNLTVRNFPQTVAQLRKRLKLNEGGDTYFFATTLADGHHALIRGIRK